MPKGLNQFFLRSVLVVSLVVAMIYAPVAWTLEIEVRQDTALNEAELVKREVEVVDFEQNSQRGAEYQLRKVGVIKAGSVVDIPDRYVTRDAQGRPSFELSLNSWLKNAADLRERWARGDRDGFDQTMIDDSFAGGYHDQSGQADWFFPVKVLKITAGSTLNPKSLNHEYMLNLGNLARTGNALIVNSDAPVYQQAPSSHELSQLEGQASCSGGRCGPTAHPVFDRLRSDLAAALKRADKDRTNTALRTYRNLTAKSGNTFQMMKQDCGFSMAELLPWMRADLHRQNLDPTVHLALMTQESAGLCYRLKYQGEHLDSLGLFQVKATNSKFPRCTHSQKLQLQKYKPNQLWAGQGPQCLENPYLNLKESMRIYKEQLPTLYKSKLTFKESESFSWSVRGFDASQFSERDRKLVELATYNGGAKYVLAAKRDLDAFNAKHGTQLNAHKWEDLKIFFFRSFLSESQKKAYTGVATPSRDPRKVLINIAYAENIYGRAPAVRAQGETSLVEYWHQILQQDPELKFSK